jgi:phosphatidate cytidylyltransferase
MSSNLLKRILSAAVLIPLLLLVLYLGGWWFFGFVVVMGTLATWEFTRMLGELKYRPSYVFAVAFLWIIALDFYLQGQSYLRPALALVLLLSLAWHVLRDKTSTPTENWLLPLAGALYIGWFGGHMLLLRAQPQGAYLVFTAVALTALADSGAFFIGRAWGKHLMAPRLSPKKTWEGQIGGIAVAAVSGPILTGLGGLGWVHGVILGLLISVLAPLGDLGVSMIKREAGVKDSGNLIPGHGGAFDRMDSMLVAGVVAYYYYSWAMAAWPGG